MTDPSPAHRRRPPTALLLGVAVGLTLAAPDRPAASSRLGSTPLTVDRLTSQPLLAGTSPSRPVWAPDSRHLAFLWNDAARPFRDVWVVAAGADVPRRLTDLGRTHPMAPPPDGDTLEALGAQASARAHGGVADLLWTPDSTAIVFVYRGDLFRVAIEGGDVQRLTRDGHGKSQVAYSPDGRFLSFLQGGDLWLWHLETGDLVQATSVAVPPVGRVPGARYQGNDVEFSSLSWSPDSQYVALEYNDRRDVRTENFPDYLGDGVRVERLRRDLPGENDHVRRLGIYGVMSGRVRFLDLPDPTDRRFSGFWWSPDGRHLLVDQSSEDVVDRYLLLVNPTDLSTRQIWHDAHERRTTRHWVSAWQTDSGGVLTVSDQDGRFRLWTTRLDAPRPVRLTDGDWSVIGHRGPPSLTVVPATREVFFVGTRQSPYERHVYRVPEGGGDVRQVTRLAGTHEPFVSPDGRTLAVLHSDDVTPPELYLIDLVAGTAEQRITHSPPEEFGRYPWVRPRYVTFRSRVDGYTLHARVIEPPGLDPTRKYPVILGPVYSNTARNAWAGTNGMLMQMLAIEGGYINLQVDIRGSVGYGRDFMNEFLGDYGGRDLDDLHSGVEYLISLGYVDPARIGIWGSSYGGTLTTGSLFRKPGVYKAGVAGAAAIRVNHFHTGDVRVAGRPNTTPRVFREQSMYNYAAGLRDHLLLIHGMQDDVVFFRDFVSLSEKLMLLGKDFEQAIAPSAAHGWSQRDYYARYMLNRLVGFFDRYLGRGPTVEATTPP
ncbi:MAG: prolyl oligopeptidase family serine peptidase [Acidobacteria bacterium]|nr:prolyl oligopeptidase family serine peptidase [Acidobacteriota bacterium]